MSLTVKKLQILAKTLSEYDQKLSAVICLEAVKRIEDLEEEVEDLKLEIVADRSR